jgi:hypothetical protein
MESTAKPSVHVTEAGFDIVPEEGKSIFEVLAEAKPTGFISITIKPDNTAYMLLHQEAPVEGVEVVTLGGR